MQPVAHKRLARGRFALRDFVFVVRKRQVNAARVDIQRFAKIFHGHRGALDVPAGTPRADGRFPEMLAGLGRLPQREIARVFLVVAIVIHARSRLYAGQVDLGELAVVREFRDAEIDRALARVGVGILLQPLDQRHHVVDVVRGADPVLRRLRC